MPCPVGFQPAQEPPTNNIDHYRPPDTMVYTWTRRIKKKDTFYFSSTADSSRSRSPKRVCACPDCALRLFRSEVVDEASAREGIRFALIPSARHPNRSITSLISLESGSSNLRHRRLGPVSSASITLANCRDGQPPSHHPCAIHEQSERWSRLK